MGFSPPSSYQLNYQARLREEVESDEGSSADQRARPKSAGWTGIGLPLQVGVGYTVRDHCDGQSLRSPGRWSVAARRHPVTAVRKEVVGLFRKFSQQFGTTSLLMDLALGRVEATPFPAQDVALLKDRIIAELHDGGVVTA